MFTQFLQGIILGVFFGLTCFVLKGSVYCYYCGYCYYLEYLSSFELQECAKCVLKKNGGQRLKSVNYVIVLMMCYTIFVKIRDQIVLF